MARLLTCFVILLAATGTARADAYLGTMGSLDTWKYKLEANAALDGGVAIPGHPSVFAHARVATGAGLYGDHGWDLTSAAAGLELRRCAHDECWVLGLDVGIIDRYFRGDAEDYAPEREIEAVYAARAGFEIRFWRVVLRVDAVAEPYPGLSTGLAFRF
jgi:hypothetical protein